MLETLVDRIGECTEELTGSAPTEEDRAETEEDLGEALDCNNVVRLRDEMELYDSCIPQTKEQDCEALIDGETPESCEGQLLSL